MGPRSFDRGNDQGTAEIEVKWQASMGPRSFDRGNLFQDNSAAFVSDVLQWGRGLSTAEIT